MAKRTKRHRGRRSGKAVGGRRQRFTRPARPIVVANIVATTLLERYADGHSRRRFHYRDGTQQHGWVCTNGRVMQYAKTKEQLICQHGRAYSDSGALRWISLDKPFDLVASCVWCGEEVRGDDAEHWRSLIGGPCPHCGRARW